jgi:hypothetical protein
MIFEGKEDEEIRKEIVKQFSEKQISENFKAHMAWYRYQVRIESYTRPI